MPSLRSSILQISKFLGSPACALAAAPLIHINSFSSSGAGNFNIGLGDSPTILEWHDPLGELLATYTRLSTRMDSLSTPESKARILALVNSLFKNASGVELYSCFGLIKHEEAAHEETGQETLRSLATSSAPTATYTTSGVPPSLFSSNFTPAEEAPMILDGFGISILMGTGIVALVALLYAIAHCFHKRELEDDEHALEVEGYEKIVPPVEYTGMGESEGENATPLEAYYRHKTKTQILLPILLVIFLYLKIFSLIGCVARVRIQVVAVGAGSGTNFSSVPDPVVAADTYLINFTFPSMVVYFWKAKAYLIALLIIGGSAALPVTKLTTLLVLWLVPSATLARWRGRESFSSSLICAAKEDPETHYPPLCPHCPRTGILALLSVMGKLCFVDAFFMAFIIVSLGVGVTLDAEMGTKIQVSTDPDLALYCAIMAHSGALIIGYYMLTMHRARPGGHRPDGKLNRASRRTLAMARARACTRSGSKSFGDRPTSSRYGWATSQKYDDLEAGKMRSVSTSTSTLLKAAMVPKDIHPPSWYITASVFTLMAITVGSIIMAFLNKQVLCFDNGGVLGDVLDKTKCYGLLSLSVLLPSDVTRPDSFIGAIVICAIYILLIAVCPLLLMFFWTMLWGVATGKRDRGSRKQ